MRQPKKISNLDNRKNQGQRLLFCFNDEDDFRQHLQWLQEYGTKYSLRIWAYCLMINHYLCEASHNTFNVVLNVNNLLIPEWQDNRLNKRCKKDAFEWCNEYNPDQLTTDKTPPVMAQAALCETFLKYENN